MMAVTRTSFLDLAFDNLDVSGVLNWVDVRDAKSAYAYVVTPNVDHMVRLSGKDRDVRGVYEVANLCLCDSRVLARLARLTGVRLRVAPGSDLVAAIFAHTLRASDRVCIIGGIASNVARLRADYPQLTIIHHTAPMGLRHDAEARAAAVAAALDARARIILIAVGSPQQELLAWEIGQSSIATGTALCIGASIDFLVGAQRRAPRLVQKAGFEWIWRLATNPKRLARRYLVDGLVIFPLVLRSMRRRTSERRA